jgi:hypothetical protein
MPAARRILATAASAVTVLATAASAHAASVSTNPCVVSLGVSSETTMPIAGTGFTPGASVTVKYSSAVSPMPEYLTSVTADPAGNIATAVSPPLFHKFDTQQQSFDLTATEDLNPANVGTTAFKQVRLGYVTTPSGGKPTRIATHTVRGFPIGKLTYLHFRFDGQTKRTVLLGKTSSPCGTVSKRIALLPTRSHPGKWTVYVDQVRKYSKTTKQQLKYSFVVSRTFA